MKRLLVLAAVVLLLTAACSSDDDTSVATEPGDSHDSSIGSDPDDSRTGIDGSWTLVMLVEEGDMAIPLPVGATIDLLIEGSEISGTAACNSFGGSVEIGEDGSFAASDLFQTEMACDPAELMETEARYLSALGSATSWAIDVQQLALDGPDAALLFER